MAEKEKVNVVHQEAIHVETIKKELRHQVLQTEFFINPFKKIHLLPDKPMARKPKEDIVEDSNFLELYHRSRDPPTRKYSAPITESQEIGWFATQAMPFSQRDDRRNFFRKCSDVTLHQELALRKGIL